MILHPAIVALLLASCLVTFIVLYAAFFGARIIRHWDITSGSERQLDLERRTYLISTLVTCAFVFQVGSLFLFIYTADDIHSRFVGAMCAAGSLNVNPYGYPAFLLKILNCVLAGLWLVMNYADSRAYDYPLLRKKLALLLVMLPFIVSETVLQGAYFLDLRPDVITSCCGSLFSSGQGSVPGDLAGLPPGPMMVAFYASILLVSLTGLLYWLTGRASWLFSLLAVAAFPVFVLSLLSFVSLYFYELPTHHCPFCVLQREYGYIGYVLYGSLIGGVVCGGGVGLLTPFRHIKSLAGIVPRVSRRLAFVSVVSYLLFVLVAVWKMATANLTLTFA